MARIAEAEQWKRNAARIADFADTLTSDQVSAIYRATARDIRPYHWSGHWGQPHTNGTPALPAHQGIRIGDTQSLLHGCAICETDWHRATENHTVNAAVEAARFQETACNGY